MLGDDLHFDRPGRYLILIKENVSHEVLAMVPCKVTQDNIFNPENHGSQLIGDFKDQSELISVLYTLYNNRCTILKVKYLSTVPGMSSSEKNLNKE
jgi:hypothetical protein